VHLGEAKIADDPHRSLPHSNLKLLLLHTVVGSRSSLALDVSDINEPQC
jgi:hypothetical protein